MAPHPLINSVLYVGTIFTGRNEVLAKVIFLHLFVILFTGGEYLTRYTPPGPDTPPLGPGAPPRDPPSRTRYTPLRDQVYKARHAHKRLYTVLPKYSKIQVLPGITSCRLVKDNKQAIELNSLLINNMPL